MVCYAGGNRVSNFELGGAHNIWRFRFNEWPYRYYIFSYIDDSTTRKLSLTRMSIPDSIRPMTPNNISIRQSNCFLSLQNADRVDVLQPQQTSDHRIATIIPRQQKNGETSAGIEIYVVRCRTTRRPII